MPIPANESSKTFDTPANNRSATQHANIPENSSEIKLITMFNAETFVRIREVICEARHLEGNREKCGWIIISKVILLNQETCRN
jgi:hypothetical protein